MTERVYTIGTDFVKTVTFEIWSMLIISQHACVQQSDLVMQPCNKKFTIPNVLIDWVNDVKFFLCGYATLIMLTILQL